MRNSIRLPRYRCTGTRRSPHSTTLSSIQFYTGTVTSPASAPLWRSRDEGEEIRGRAENGRRVTGSRMAMAQVTPEMEKRRDKVLRLHYPQRGHVGGGFS